MSFLTLEILCLFATNRPVFLIMVLLSHQFIKLQIYSVKVSNTFPSLHELKEIFNDNANFALRKGILSSLLRDSQEPKRPDKITQFKRDNLYTKIMQQKIQVSVSQLVNKELENSSRKQKIYISNDCRYMKIIYVHCGEETNLRDFRSQKDQIRFPNLKEIIYAGVSQLEPKLVTLMDRCLPLKTVTMSSRDPALMSPLVKSLLKKKFRLSCNSKD